MDRTSDYKSLYEQQREENEEHKRRISELEARQRVLECSFRGLRQLRTELVILNKECEKNEGNIHNFLSSFLPEYKECTNAKFDSNNNTDAPKDDKTKNRHFQDQIKLFTGKNTDKSRSEESSTESVEVTDVVGERLPVPTVSYDWSSSPTHGSSARMPSYLPKTGYSMSSLSSRPSLYSRPVLLDDELKLTLKFDNCPSRNLPTKLQLEICDAEGNVVFRKRQNIYYVKLQEKLATLDSGHDYVLTVTSIQGVNKTTEKVTIHNKNYQPPPTTAKPCMEKTVIAEMPELMTALQEFSEEVQFFEECESRRQPESPLSCLVSAVPVTEENTVHEVKRTSALVLQRAPLEDDDEISSSTSGIGTSLNSIDRPMPLIMQRKPILPMEIRTRWQRGFRRKSGSGQYVKVPILRVEIDFDPDQFELLPSDMTVSVSNGCLNMSHSSAVNSYQSAKLAHNRRYCSEFPLFDSQSAVQSCCSLQVRISENGSNTSLAKKAAALIPDFSVNVAPYPPADSGLSNDWEICTPQLLQLF